MQARAIIIVDHKIMTGPTRHSISALRTVALSRSINVGTAKMFADSPGLLFLYRILYIKSFSILGIFPVDPHWFPSISVFIVRELKCPFYCKPLDSYEP